MIHLAAIVLLGSLLLQPLHASVIGDGVVESVRLVRLFRSELPEVARLAGRTGEEAVEACGERGLIILRETQQAKGDVVAVAEVLARHPHIAMLGLDGVRVAREVGPQTAQDIGRFGPRALRDAAGGTSQASRWGRVAREADLAGLDNAAMRQFGDELAAKPGALDKVLRHAPQIGLVAALALVGIQIGDGIGEGLAKGLPKAVENVSTPVGRALFLVISLIGGTAAAWLLVTKVLPAWRRSRQPTLPLLLLGCLATGGLRAEDAWQTLQLIERQDLEAVEVANRPIVAVPEADALRLLQTEAGSPIAAVGQIADNLRDHPQSTRDSQQVVDDLQNAWLRQRAHLERGLKEREMSLRLALPYELEQAVAWLPPELPAWPAQELPMQALRDHLGLDGDIRLGASAVVVVATWGNWAADVTMLAADEGIARGTSAHSAPAMAAATRALIRTCAERFKTESYARVQAWQRHRRQAIAAAIEEILRGSKTGAGASPP